MKWVNYSRIIIILSSTIKSIIFSFFFLSLFFPLFVIQVDLQEFIVILHLLTLMWNVDTPLNSDFIPTHDSILKFSPTVLGLQRGFHWGDTTHK